MSTLKRLISGGFRDFTAGGKAPLTKDEGDAVDDRHTFIVRGAISFGEHHVLAIQSR